jgi:hypothetical protein
MLINELNIYFLERGSCMINKTNKGYALGLVLIVMAVLSILGAALLNISVSENKQVIYQEKSKQAYYMARSGADAMASYIIQNVSNPSLIQSVIDKTSTHSGTGGIDSNNFKVKVTKIGSTLENLLINSTGIVNGVPDANVSLTLKHVVSPILNYGIYTNNNLTTPKNITGDIGSNSGVVGFNGSYSGNITLGPGATTSYAGPGTVTHLSEPIPFPLINESLFTVPYDGTSTIDLAAGEKRYMWVNNLSQLTVSGNGQLHLLVKNSFTLIGNNSVVSQGSAKIFLYYNKTDTIDFKGTPSFNGVIYAPNATVDCSGNGNGTFNGSLIAKAYNGGNSNASQYVYDPTLKATDLVVNGAQTYLRISWGK